jgi:hypothetical protein
MYLRRKREPAVNEVRDILMSLTLTMHALRRSAEPDDELVARMNDDLRRLEQAFERLDHLLDDVTLQRIDALRASSERRG